MNQRLVVGISGASGVILGVRLLEVLCQNPQIETHLILSSAAERTLALEGGPNPEAVKALANFTYDPTDLAAGPSSGSFLTMGMVVLPCSIKSLSAIAHSYADNLLARAADVTLKEHRPLVLCPRETPLHLGHLRLLTQVAEAGAMICPPIPAYYHGPTEIAHLIDQSVGKVLDLLKIEHNLFTRWGTP